MWSWLQDYGPLLLAWAGVQVVLAGALGFWAGWWPWQLRLGAFLVRLASPRPAPLVPRNRPIEQVGADVRRLRDAFGREGVRFAKWEGIRRAYDGVLAEAADTLELSHGLADLPPGADRDFERVRVERLLEDAGLLTRLHAA
ncbi:hypothetical protein [Nocardioides zhouii]|uniref:Uncharacterized protein n=1 Tax=Nocardioides zhouii TaxID=1168729 RepID=A0A4Q2T2A8_9ACTN|nr:hypothetical protein [Nocardioides zhouii]RYC12602.1 hypothetical protein EUA94_08010 [Nocardioides zhouii]